MKLAAIDIGSNAIRLIIYMMITTDPIQQKRSEFIRIPVRLGDDVFTTGKIGKDKTELLVKSLSAFSLIMEVHKVHDYMACATSAMREANNSDEVIARVEAETGIKIQVIDGLRESELILESVVRFFPEHGNFINIDVGGGSTEMTLIRNHKPVLSETFNIGTVRSLYDSIDESETDRMELWVKENISDIKNLKAIGTGGNINKALRMLEMGEREAISYDKLRTLYQFIKNLTLKERITRLKLNPDRADVIEPALKIHLQIMKKAGIKKIYAPNAGLKDGMIKELIERHLSLLTS